MVPYSRTTLEGQTDLRPISLTEYHCSCKTVMDVSTCIIYYYKSCPVSDANLLINYYPIPAPLDEAKPSFT